MSHALVIVALKPPVEDLVSAVDHQMSPFDENGEWFADGSRWDWYTIGGRYQGRLLGLDVIERKELTEEALVAYQEKRAAGWWSEYETEASKGHGEDAVLKTLVYGLQKDDTLETLTSRLRSHKLSAYAFLSNRHWHEGERMGWFGAPATTECERSDEYHIGKCLHKDEETGARIICWNEPEDAWSERFFDRFIKPLPPETILVAVDYHV